MWAGPGGLQAGALSGAAGQVVVGGGVPELGPLQGQTSAGCFGQREAALLLLGVQRGGGRGQPQSLHLQGFGAPPGCFDYDVLKPLGDLLSLCGDGVLLCFLLLLTEASGGRGPADRRVSPVRDSRTSAPASLLSGDESRWLLTLWLRWL